MAMLSIFATVIVFPVAGQISSFSELYKNINVKGQGAALSIPDLSLRIWLGDPIEISHFRAIFSLSQQVSSQTTFYFWHLPKVTVRHMAAKLLL